jgi:hypothetical protein
MFDDRFMQIYKDLKPLNLPYESQFIRSTVNSEFMTSDLVKSGLEQYHVCAHAPPMLSLKPGALAGYVIPYFGLDGKRLDRDGDLYMYRTRMQFPEYSRESRYTQPSTEQLARYDLPPTIPYIHPIAWEIEGDCCVVAEGEKKAVSVMRNRGLPTIGIGGCQMWRNPDGTGTLHPWISRFLRERGFKKVLIIPDGDIFRYDICTAYGTFVHALGMAEFEVTMLNPGGKIDDLLMDSEFHWSDMKPIKPHELVQSPASLIAQLGLAFKTDAKNRPIVHQHTSNICRILEGHKAFPFIWRNLDTSMVMIGQEEAQPGRTEMDITNHFQHNFGFDRVSHKTVLACVQAIAMGNSHSPMFEWIKKQRWDGVARLDTWMIDLWGALDAPYVREVSRKWLLSACARMDKPGSKVDWMLIVVGPQGTGKSSMPEVMFRGNANKAFGDGNDKDLYLKLHSGLCTGFDELDSFSRKTTSFLKSLITETRDAFRPPYGASIEVFPRRFVFYGCGNRHEFLQHDPSGYRRYAVIAIARKLDFAGLEAAVGQIWAEAWYRYSSGESGWWEIEGASEIAEQYVVADPLEDKIESALQTQSMAKHGGSVVNGELWFTMNELLLWMGMDKVGGGNPIVKDVSAILRKMGVTRIDKNSRRPGDNRQGRWFRYSCY